MSRGARTLDQMVAVTYHNVQSLWSGRQFMHPSEQPRSTTFARILSLLVTLLFLSPIAGAFPENAVTDGPFEHQSAHGMEAQERVAQHGPHGRDANLSGVKVLEEAYDNVEGLLLDDFDGDGSEELLVSWEDWNNNQAGYTLWDLSTQQSKEEVAVNGWVAWFPTPTNQRQYLVDLDGNGQQEIVFAYDGGFGTSLYIYEFGGVGELLDESLDPVGNLWALELTDADDDGVLDIVAAGGDWNTGYPAWQVWDPLGDVLLAEGSVTGWSNVQMAMIGDVEGDGPKEVYFSTSEGNDTFLVAYDLMAQTEDLNLTVDFGLNGFDVRDRTGDTMSEIVLGGNDLVNGTPITHYLSASGSLLTNISSDNLGFACIDDDLTGDTLPDLFFGGWDGELLIIDGSDGSVFLDSSHPNLNDVSCFDHDGDGVYGLLVYEPDWGAGTYDLSLYDSSDTVVWTVDLGDERNWEDSLADFNGDGQLDIPLSLWDQQLGGTYPMVIDGSTGDVLFTVDGNGFEINTIAPMDLDLGTPGTEVAVDYFDWNNGGGALYVYNLETRDLFFSEDPIEGMGTYLLGGPFGQDSRAEIVRISQDVFNGGATLTIWVFDAAPLLLAPVPDLETLEGTTAYGVIDLEDFYGDDYEDGTLLFAVVLNPMPILVDLQLNGSKLDLIINDPDWNGMLVAQVRGADLVHAGVLSNEFNITVVPVNDPPQWETIEPQFVQQDQLLSLDLLATDADGDELAFTTNSTVGDIDGTLFNWTPGSGDVGVHTFWFSVEDVAAAFSTLSVKVTVQNRNDPPTFLPFAPPTAVEDQIFIYALPAADPDLGNGDHLVFSSTDPRVTVNAGTGVLSFVPTNAEVGTIQIPVSVADNGGGLANGLLTVEVTNTPDSPTLEADVPESVHQGSTLLVKLHGSDPDAGEILSYGVELPGGAAAPFAIGASDGKGHWVPTNADVGEWSFDFWVKDSSGLRTMVTQRVTVVNVNDAPTARFGGSSTNYFEVSQEDNWTATLVLEDPDLPHGDALSVLVDDDSIDVTQNSSTAASLTWVPHQADVGEHSITILVTDQGGLTAVVSATINVIDINDPPLAEITAPSEGAVITAGTLTLIGAGTDPDPGSTLTLTWFVDDKEVGDGPAVTIHLSKLGRHEIRLQVSDGTHEVSAISHIRVKAPVGGDVLNGAAGAVLVPMLLLVIAGMGVVIALLLRGRKGGQAALPSPAEEPSLDVPGDPGAVPLDEPPLTP